MSLSSQSRSETAPLRAVSSYNRPAKRAELTPLVLPRNLPEFLAEVDHESSAPKELRDLVFPCEVGLVKKRLVLHLEEAAHSGLGPSIVARRSVSTCLLAGRAKEKNGRVEAIVCAQRR